MRALAAVIVVAAGCGAGSPAPAPRARAADAAPRREAAGRPAEPPPAIQGRAGQVELATAAGQPTRLAAHGKPITVIALWAQFCAPCIDELPYVEALHRARLGDDVAVLAVNIDDRTDPAIRDRVAEIERALGLTLPRLYGGEDLMMALAPRDASGNPKFLLPLLVVIDREFRVHRRIGFDAGTSVADYVAEKRALIAAARRGEPPAPDALPRPRPGAGTFKLTLPRMTARELTDWLPRFRAELHQAMPQLDDAALDRVTAKAAEAARQGGELELDLAELGAAAP